MPPSRRPQAIRDTSDMVDDNALHITPEQGAVFGERREVMKESEAKALREQAAQAELLRQQLDHALTLQGQQSALSVQEGGALVIQGFHFSPKGLIAPEEFSPDAWEKIGHLLLRMEGSIQWLIGDWLVYGEGVKWGDATKFADTFGRDPATLHNYASVSRGVQFSFRNENLSYTHHVAVMGLTPEQQQYALKHAADEKLSVAKFRQWLDVQLGRVQPPTLSSGNILDLKPLSTKFKRFMKEDRNQAEEYLNQIERWLAESRAELRGGKK